MARPSTKTPILVRRSIPADEASLQQLFTEEWGNFQAVVCRDLGFLMSGKTNITVVAADGNAIVGAVMMALGPAVAFHGLCVRQTHRHKGIAQAVLSFAIDDACQHTATREIHALIDRSDRKQISRFKRFGFVREKDRRRFDPADLVAGFILMVFRTR